MCAVSHSFHDSECLVRLSVLKLNLKKGQKLMDRSDVINLKCLLMCQQSYFNSRRRDSVREGEKSDEVIQNVIKNIFYAIFYYVPTPDTRPGQ